MKILIVVCCLLTGAVIALILNASRRTPPERSPEEIRAELMAELDAFEARRHVRPPLFEPTVEGTAAEQYREAFAAIDRAFGAIGEDLADEVSAALSEWEGIGTPLPDCVRGFLPRAEPVFEALVRGACCGEAGQITHVRDVLSDRDDAVRPYDQSNLIRVLVNARAAALEEDGDAGEAMWLLLALARLGTDYPHGGDMIAQLVGMSVQASAITGLARLAELGALGNAERTVLREQVEGWWRAAPDRTEFITAEFLGTRRMFQQTADGEAWPPNLDPGIRDEFGREAFYRVGDIIGQAAASVPESEHGDLGRYGGLLIALDILDFRERNGNLPEALPVDRERSEYLAIRLSPTGVEIGIRESEDTEPVRLFRLSPR